MYKILQFMIKILFLAHILLFRMLPTNYGYYELGVGIRLKTSKNGKVTGCPCRGYGLRCGSSCTCGNKNKPCRNKVNTSVKFNDKYVHCNIVFFIAIKYTYIQLLLAVMGIVTYITLLYIEDTRRDNT